MKKLLQASLAAVVFLGPVGDSFAVGTAGIGNEVLSAKSLGMGGVGVSGATDDLATIFLNPAGLTTFKGTQITIGATWEDLHTKYEGTDQSSKMRSLDVIVPNFAIAQSLMDGKLGLGVGTFTDFGLETHWPGDGPLRYVATNSRLHIMDVTPGIAYKIHPKISIGLGADYVNVPLADLEKNVNMNNVNNAILVANSLPPAYAGLSDGVSNLEGTASNWGYHAGVMVQPNERHTIGFAYHSRVKLDINGSVSLTNISGVPAQTLFGGENFSTSANTVLYLPQSFQFGYQFKATEKWHLEMDTAWFDWNPNKDLNVRYPELDPNNPLDAGKLAILTNNGNGNPVSLNWRNTWNLEAGVNYLHSEKLQIRGGFYYEPWVGPESAFNPNLPDLTRYGVTTGLGYAFTKSVIVDLAYNAVFQQSRHISNDVGFNSTGDPTVTVNGHYETFTNVASVNFRYKFGNSQ